MLGRSPFPGPKHITKTGLFQFVLGDWAISEVDFGWIYGARRGTPLLGVRIVAWQNYGFSGKK